MCHQYRGDDDPPTSITKNFFNICDSFMYLNTGIELQVNLVINSTKLVFSISMIRKCIYQFMTSVSGLPNVAFPML